MRTQYRPTKEETTLSNEDKAFKLRVQGWSQPRIADELGMTQQGVSKALKRATQKFAKAYLEDVKQIKNERVAQLEHVANEAIEAWYKSKEAKKSTRFKVKGIKDSDKPTVGEKTNIEENQFGDPRYLEQFRKAKSDIRDILGAKYIVDDFSDEPISGIKINIIRPGDKLDDAES